MTSAKTIFAAAAVATAAFTAQVTAQAQASETVSIKPTHAVTFKSEGAPAVGYYLAEHGHCRLFLTLSDGSQAGEAISITRLETLVQSGKSERVAGGEFGCHADAQAMSFTPISAIAAAQ